MLSNIKENDPLVSFEKNMDSLIQSIQQFNPNCSLSFDLISDSDKIGNQISCLSNKIDELSKFDQTIKKKHNDLSNDLKDILINLSECKKQLDLLPKNDPITDTETDNFNTQDTKTVLSYALKLSKFSKIPRTFDGFLLPNNFIWPGDDNMRRGNLAMSSIIPDKIVNFENYGSDYVPPVSPELPIEHLKTMADTKVNTDNNINNNNNEDIDDDEFEDNDFLPERQTSIDQSTSNENPAQVITGLDLLDSDDE